MKFTTHFRKTTAALAALLLVLSVFGPVGTVTAQPGVSVTQSADSTTVNPGDPVTLTTQFSVSELNAPQLSATTPDGWEIESQSATGPVAYNDGVWTWLAGDNDGVTVSYTVEYTVSVPDDAAPGDYTLSTDGSALSPSDSSETTDGAATTITVADDEPATNNPPTADAGDDQTVDEGTSVSLDAGDSDDSDGSIASYTWMQTAGPSVSLANPSTATPSFTAPDVDSDTTFTFEVTVTDDDGETDTDTVSVTVQDTDTTDPPAGDMETSVSLSPTSSETFVGGTTTYDIVVDNADGGVGAYSATVSLDDVSVGSITDVELEGSPAGQTTTVDIASDGSSVSIDAALMNTADTGSVTVATITVQGGSAGSTDLSTTFEALGNEQGNSYTVTDASGASLSVTEKSTSVSLSPTSSEISVDDTTTYDIVVDNAEGGVGAYTATVSLDDASVGSITDVELEGSPAEQTTNVDIASDGSSVSIDAALMDTADSGNVVVATITVQGVDAGSTDLSVSASALGDEAGNNYAVTGTNGASLTVTEVTVGNFADPVTDTNGDGEYEDINGDGTFNIVDVQALFANLDDAAVQNNVEMFDFNNDNTVNIVDVQALFFELVSSV